MGWLANFKSDVIAGFRKAASAAHAKPFLAENLFNFLGGKIFRSVDGFGHGMGLVERHGHVGLELGYRVMGVHHGPVYAAILASARAKQPAMVGFNGSSR